MMTYQELETKLQTQQTQIDNLLSIVERQQNVLDVLLVKTEQLEDALMETANSTAHNGQYIAGQIASKDGR